MVKSESARGLRDIQCHVVSTMNDSIVEASGVWIARGAQKCSMLFLPLL